MLSQYFLPLLLPCKGAQLEEDGLYVLLKLLCLLQEALMQERADRPLHIICGEDAMQDL
jgi:hypothetical protein